MYGMLLESVHHFVQLEYGEEIWQQVMEEAGCKFAVFSTHHIYPDSLMTNLATACAVIIGEGATPDHFIKFFGRCFLRSDDQSNWQILHRLPAKRGQHPHADAFHVPQNEESLHVHHPR